MIEENPAFKLAFDLEGVHGLTIFLAVVSGEAAVVFLTGFLLGMNRKLAFVRRSYIAAYVFWFSAYAL